MGGNISTGICTALESPSLYDDALKQSPNVFIVQTPVLALDKAALRGVIAHELTHHVLKHKWPGIETKIGNHTFRATGITAYLKNSGKLEVAQYIANHESPRTTKLYDRRQDEISLDEIERIAI